MKNKIFTCPKTILFLFLFIIHYAAAAQVITMTQGFDSYDGSLPSVPAGWRIVWNSTSSPSYYASTNNYGASAPSYKFGVDADSIITGSFTTSDTLSFWIKGQGATFSDADTLTILWTADSITWHVLAYLDSLPIVGTNMQFPVDPSAVRLLFIFTKYYGNLAIDDIILTHDTSTGIIEKATPADITLFPNPSNGNFVLNNPNTAIRNFKITVTDILGNEVINPFDMPIHQSQNPIQLSSLKDGIYFLRILEGTESTVKKVAIRR
ncbi:MAG: T9SS type A sorting domain-containing protein [Bacteroidota bacterium]